MLRIVQNQAAASAKTYYSAGAYYSEGQELAGEWRGKAAARLGLTGAINQVDFDALCDNLNPQTGERLTVRTRTGRTVGYDVNLHVPKGVSLAYALGGDERILAAFRDSLRETMAEFERDAETRVRVGGRDQNRNTGNLVWGEFIHKTARPVNGIPDPHVHAHCFAFNVTFDETEQRFKAAQFRHLKQDARYYEALAHARLARRVAALGYTIERNGGGWDIAEIPKTLRDKFSRRRDQVEELARAKGITDAARKDGLGARTRERKLSEYTMPELTERWLAQLPDHEVARLRPPKPGRTADPEVEERSARDAVEAAIEHCFQQSAVLPERAVLGEALRRGVGCVVPGDIDRAAHESLIVRMINGRRLATTAEALSDERDVCELVRAGCGKEAPLYSGWAIEGNGFSDEARRAVRQLLESRDRVQILYGNADAVETSLMHEVAEAIHRSGRQLWPLVSPLAISRSEPRDEGCATATTVAELLGNESQQREAAGQAWWVAEAELLPVRQFHDLIRLADRQHARLILVTKWPQQGGVERSSHLQQFVTDAGISSARLAKNRRMHDGDQRRAASECIAAQRERQAIAERHLSRDRIASASQGDEPRPIVTTLDAADGA